MRDLAGQARRVVGHAQLANFIEALADSLLEDPETWENDTLPEFLRALAAWTKDMEGYFTFRGLTVPEQPSWTMFAEMLMAARIYE